MVEISKATLACGLLVPSPIEAHDITRKAIENKVIDISKINHDDGTKNIKITIIIF